MLNLGDTGYWFDVAPAGDCWLLLRVEREGKGVRMRLRTETIGRYSSPQHLLTCAPVLKLPKPAVAAIEDLVFAMGAGDALLDAMPVVP